MIDLEQRYQRNDNFVFRRIEDETILVPIKDNVGDMGSIYNLNDVGAFVWEQIDGVKSLQDIKNRLLAEYEISSREAEDDLFEYIAQLKEIDALRLIRIDRNRKLKIEY
jgi:hypothetical protein